MTRRERLEAKLQKRREWAESRAEKAAMKIRQAIEMTSCIPMGQPVLVGHHSEKSHRRLLARSDSAMRSGISHSEMAQRHASRADGLEEQLNSSIFSDDQDAAEQIEAKIAHLEAERARMKAANAAYRKGGIEGLRAFAGDAAAIAFEQLKKLCPYEKQPYPPYKLSNLGGNIGRLKQRLQVVRDRKSRENLAASSEDGIVISGNELVRITFAEKPPRSIIADLKAAGFRWSSGSWRGKREAIPSSLRASRTR